MIKKYKAFLKDEKRTVDVDVIFFETEVVKVTDNNFYQFEEVYLMQSTGAHDDTKFEDLKLKEKIEWLKSGKTEKDWKGREIFEGDIVKSIYDSEIFTGVVVYDLSETDYKSTSGQENYGHEFIYLTGNDSNEVVGNMYENHRIMERGLGWGVNWHEKFWNRPRKLNRP